jgi:hypothetical protein
MLERHSAQQGAEHGKNIVAGFAMLKQGSYLHPLAQEHLPAV